MMRLSSPVPALSATWCRFVADESGATAIEYGLMAALIGLSIMGTISATGQAIKTSLYDQIGNTLSGMSR
jgi:pilus assembly protein Flp/PilA